MGGSFCSGNFYQMHWTLLWMSLVPFAAVSVAFILFLARALEVREEHPELLQKFVGFFIPFLLTSALSPLLFVLLPLYLVAMLTALFLPKRLKGIILWAGTGGLAGAALLLAYLFLLNTYAMPATIGALL